MIDLLAEGYSLRAFSWQMYLRKRYIGFLSDFTAFVGDESDIFKESRKFFL